VLIVLALSAAAAMPALAANPKPQADLLILGSTVTHDPITNLSPEETAAKSLGLSVEVVSDAAWASKTAADFSAYKAIVLGDPTAVIPGVPPGIPDRVCADNPAPVAAATANANVWGPAVTGNVIVIGSDPAFSSSFNAGPSVGLPAAAAAAQLLIKDSIQFASRGAGKTGAYVSLSCYYSFTNPNTPVPLLNAFGKNQFAVSGNLSMTCFDNAHIVQKHPALAGLTDASLSNWGCSVQEAFDRFSPAFLVLAVALDDPNSPLIPSDPTSGSPWILARGFAPGATPELDSLLLFGTGLAGVAGYLRLRRTTKSKP
jgi:hypothetical protein